MSLFNNNTTGNLFKPPQNDDDEEDKDDEDDDNVGKGDGSPVAYDPLANFEKGGSKSKMESLPQEKSPYVKVFYVSIYRILHNYKNLDPII